MTMRFNASKSSVRFEHAANKILSVAENTPSFSFSFFFIIPPPFLQTAVFRRLVLFLVDVFAVKALAYDKKHGAARCL